MTNQRSCWKRSRALCLLWSSILVTNCSGFVARRGAFRRTSRQPHGSLFALETNKPTSSHSDDFIDKSDLNRAIVHPSQDNGTGKFVLAPNDSTKKSGGRKLDLMWCSGAEGACKESMRERVVGENNVFEFDGPATGQVCFTWSGDDGEQSDTDEEEDASKKASILFLVKRKDEQLLQVAADAIRELTDSGIQVYLVPEMAAKIEHNYGVHNKQVHLFEPRSTPGFGGNHVPSNDKWMMNHYEEPIEEQSSGLDMVVTLGGDGLLMHANVMFQGPVPPILCVAGGSLGFLTPFSREEMVEAILVSLGVARGEKDDNTTPRPEDPVAIMPYEAIAKKGDHYLSGDSSEASVVPKFKFGLGNKICLSMRMRLECKVINREGHVRARFNVLNEVTIDRGSSPYLAALECFCDNVHLTTVQADGVIFATPTGSTAYSMAAGGSVVHPAVPAILVTPICPHVLSFRSMVFPDSVVLRCYVPDDARSSASVAFDGRYRRTLHRGDSVQIQMSPHPVPTINRVDHSADWLYSLKQTFNFNTRQRQRPL